MDYSRWYYESSKGSRHNLVPGEIIKVHGIASYDEAQEKLIDEIISFCAPITTSGIRFSEIINSDITVVLSEEKKSDIHHFDPPYTYYKEIQDNGRIFRHLETVREVEDDTFGEYISSRREVVLYLGSMTKREMVISTLIHELFHAWFDIKTPDYIYHRSLQDWKEASFIEEPIVEFCTLSFLNSLKGLFKEFSPIFEDYLNSVEKKKDCIGPSAAYGFGHYLFSKRRDGLVKLIPERYLEVSRILLNGSDTFESDAYRQYHDMVYPAYSKNEEATMLDNIKYLFYAIWKIPEIDYDKLHRHFPNFKYRLSGDKQWLEGTFDWLGSIDKEDINISTIKVFPHTNIPDYAFQGLPSLKSITIPDTCKIGIGILSNCVSLQKVSLGSRDTINSEMFSGCKSLQSISTESIVEIKHDAFRDSGITDINLENCKIIGDNAFENTLLDYVDIPNSCSLGKSVFVACGRLLKAKFHGEILPESTFEGCPLTSFESTCLNEIRDRSFKGCRQLHNFSFEGIKKIGAMAFMDSGIESIVSASVEEIGANSFSHCRSLAIVKLDHIEVIGDGAFSWSPVASVELSSLEELGHTVFFRCFNLKDIKIQGPLSSIPSGTFRRCNKNTMSISLSPGIYVDENAFN